MAEVQREDHVEIAKELLEQWSDKPKVMGLVESYFREVNELEGLLFELLNGRSIYTGVGVQLDIIGSLFNERRDGRDDETYRSAILGRISQQYADGTTEKFMQSLRITSGSDYVDFWEHMSADIHAYMGKGVSFNTWSSVLNAAPAGVSVRIIFDDEEDSFVPAEILLPAYDLQTNLLEDIQTNNGEDIQMTIGISSFSERSIPSEIQDSVLFNPLADLAFSDVGDIAGRVKINIEDLLVHSGSGYVVYQEYYFK